eukprot:901973-Lingulodinium_polyedra.AAC.1
MNLGLVAPGGVSRDSTGPQAEFSGLEDCCPVVSRVSFDDLVGVIEIGQEGPGLPVPRRRNASGQRFGSSLTGAKDRGALLE